VEALVEAQVVHLLPAAHQVSKLGAVCLQLQAACNTSKLHACVPGQSQTITIASRRN
jgi:hypothetical protein